MLREAPQSDPMTFLSTTPHHFAEHLCTPWGWRCGPNPPGSRNVAPSQQCEHIVEDLTFGRVAAGSYPPAAPTDPGVPHSGTRLLR